MAASYLPAEWSAQDAVLLTWPHANADWADQLAAAETVFFAIAAAILPYQALVLICHDEALKNRLERCFAERSLALHRCFFIVIANNDCWARDHGPITVFDPAGRPVWLNFSFSGWGGKYDARLDNQINDQLFGADFIGVPAIERQDLVLEGGAIETDGKGTLLVRSSCVADPARNGDISRDELTARFAALFGCRQVLWLEHGQLSGDDTDGHIDTLARFTPHGGIVHVSCDDPADPDAAALAHMALQLKSFLSADGKPFTLYPLPWPKARYNAGGHRLPLSYANYLIINGAVLVPTYQDPADAQALSVIRRAYPDLAVHGIDCLALVQQYGSLHCVTMQLPRGCLSPQAARRTALPFDGAAH